MIFAVPSNLKSPKLFTPPNCPSFITTLLFSGIYNVKDEPCKIVSLSISNSELFSKYTVYPFILFNFVLLSDKLPLLFIKFVFVVFVISMLLITNFPSFSIIPGIFIIILFSLELIISKWPLLVIDAPRFILYPDKSIVILAFLGTDTSYDASKFLTA